MDSKLHDHGYGYLFADPEMVRQLLQTCVDEPWVKEIVIEQLEPLPTKLVDRRLVHRQTDLLLRARLRGRQTYVLIVLELQSRPDRFMALRLLGYQCQIWQSLVEQSRRHAGTPTLRRLPPVFPVVLYRGDRAWTEPRRHEDLVADAELGGLAAYVPRYTHHLIEARSFSPARLDEARNVISLLFTLESADARSLQERAAKVAVWLKEVVTENPELVARFMSWLRVRFHADNRRAGEVRPEDVLVPGGIDTMLETNIKKWAEQERKAGREEGREVGREEGREVGREEGREVGREEGREVGRREAQLALARRCWPEASSRPRSPT
jgi:predicted transposase YdaD